MTSDQVWKTWQKFCFLTGVLSIYSYVYMLFEGRLSLTCGRWMPSIPVLGVISAKIKIHVRLAREQTYEEHQIRLEPKITLGSR